jgi:Zn-dependent metalloprotease
MKKISCIILLLLPLLVSAQDKKRKQSRMGNPIDVKLSEKSNSLGFIKYDPEKAPNFANFRAIAKEAFEMSASDNLVAFKAEKDDIGFTHHRFQQTYQNYPVEWAVYIVHEKNGRILSMNGEYHQGIQMSNQVSLSEKSALGSATDLIGAVRYKWEVPGEEEAMKKILDNPGFTYAPKGQLVVLPVEEKDKYAYRYAYKFDIFADEPYGRWNVYVDAQTGKVLKQLSLIHEADVTGTAKTKYSGTVEIKVDSIAPDTFRLRETGRGGGIETYNQNNGTNISTAIDFLDNDNYWDNVNAKQDEVATDVHWGAEKTYDYFLTVHNRNSYNNAGGKIISYVHYSTNYINASWNGYFMRYGDGGSGYKPLTSLDICGHELAHGVTGNSAGLIYQRESGALNESFSDIFGNSIEEYYKKSSMKWNVGEDINNGSGLRDMSNPNVFTDPDTYRGTYWMDTDNCIPGNTNDNCGVHKNSGVQNFWFYLLAVGGSGKNDLDSLYSVTGIGFEKAAKIAYRNLTTYLTANSGYLDAAFFSIQAAADLYGANSNEVIQTTEAWFAVGIGRRYTAVPIADFEVRGNQCTDDATYTFLNKSGGATSFVWDFGDGATSMQRNPSHKYNAPGSYTVKLIATSSGSGDTLIRTDYINIYTDTVRASACKSPVGNIQANTGIFRVELNTINHASSDGVREGGYKDFTCVRTTVSPSVPYDITITTNPTDKVFTRVWIDYDNNGTYSYPGELAFFTDTTAKVHKGTIVIPDSAKRNIPLRVRITEGKHVSGNSPNTPCNVIRYGQIEDYTLIVDGTTSIAFASMEDAFTVYPNPSTGRIMLASGKGGDANISVLNALGEEVLRVQHNLSQPKELDLSSRTKGLYFLRITSSEGSVLRKVVLY